LQFLVTDIGNLRDGWLENTAVPLNSLAEGDASLSPIEAELAPDSSKRAAPART